MEQNLCGKMFETSMKLVSQVAIERNKDDKILNEVVTSTSNSDPHKNFSLVFHESMLSEFL